MPKAKCDAWVTTALDNDTALEVDPQELDLNKPIFDAQGNVALGAVEGVFNNQERTGRRISTYKIEGGL